MLPSAEVQCDENEGEGEEKKPEPVPAIITYLIAEQARKAELKLKVFIWAIVSIYAVLMDLSPVVFDYCFHECA